MKAIVCLTLGLVGGSLSAGSFAQTNSWISPTRGYWDDYTKWSLGVAPANVQTVYVTNDVWKTVTIDDVTAWYHPETLTVSNLFLSSPAGVSNVLALVNTAAITPLRILDTLSVGSGASLYLTNSALSARSLTNNITNCFFTVDGNMQMDSNSIVTADSGLYVGVDTNANSIVLLNGGQLLLTNTVVSAIGVNGTGQVTLAKGQIQSSSGFILVGSGKGSQGTVAISGGTLLALSYPRLSVGMETGSVGAVSVTAGTISMTNGFLTLVGGDGEGSLSLLNKTNLLGPIIVSGNPGALGTFTTSGSSNVIQGGLILGDSPNATGTMWMVGGRLVQTNSYLIFGVTNYLPTFVASHGVGTLHIANASWYGGTMVVGVRSNSVGVVNLNSGTMTLLSTLALGSWSNAYGEFNLNGGSLNVTNAAGTAALIVGGPARPTFPFTNCNNCAFPGFNGDGAFFQNGGTVTADQLVMTNGSSSVYNFTSGTLQTKATTVSGLQKFIVFNISNPTNETSSTIVTNPQTFVVGDGIQSATFRLLGGVHTFVTDLDIRTNALLTGCGTINGNVLVEGSVLADCGGNMVFTGTVTNNSVMKAVNGTTLEFYGPVVNNGFIDASLGNTNFHAGVVNNGIILDANGDYDGDGMSNQQEALAGTDPTNAASYFRVTSILPQGNDLLVIWSAATNKSYVVQASTNDGFTNAFSDIGTVTVPGSPFITETNYLDAGALTNVVPRFYRIKVLTP